MEELDPKAEKIYRIKDELHCVEWEKNEAVGKQDFLKAAQLRDRALTLRKQLEELGI